MVKFEKLDMYRKMRLWINEVPEESKDATTDKILEYSGNKDIKWFNGILCLELRIAPRAASNYAMLSLKFTQNQSSKFHVLYHVSDKEELVDSDIAMKNDLIKTGIAKKYNSALTQLFDELDSQSIFPSGILEILGGRYGSMGSSDIAVKIVLKNLLKLFALDEELDNSNVNSIILEGCK